MKKNKHIIGFVLLFAVIIVAAVFRLWKLGSVPVSMSDDETRLVMSAYSIWKTGRDLNGNFLPLSFVVNGYSFNPVPIYLTSPFVGMLGLSMVSARLPFAIAGILTVLFVYLIAEKLTRNESFGMLSALVLSVSVWHLTISRFAYEGGLALMFFTIGTYFFLLVKKRSYAMLIAALVAFLLGFFSYSGYKLTFLPILLLLVWYQRKELVLKQVVLTVSAIVVTFGLLFYLSKTQGALKYGGDLVFFQDKAAIEETVELERRASAAPEFVKRLYYNKGTYVLRTFLEHYLYGYSPQYLILDQEASGIFSVWSRGQLYYHEAILLLLGILFLFLKNRQQLFLILSLLAVAGLPAGLGPGPFTYTIRNSFALPWFSILIASGIVSVGTFIRGKNIQLVFYTAIGLLYVYFIGGYLSQYYFDWSRYGAKYYSVADRDLATFITDNKNSKTAIFISDGQMMTFLQYAFYANISPDVVQMVINQKTMNVGSVVFDSACINLSQETIGSKVPLRSLFVMSASCFDRQTLKTLLKPSTVITSYDGQNEWYVFET